MGTQFTPKTSQELDDLEMLDLFSKELDDLEMLDLFIEDDTPLEAPEQDLGHAGALATPIIQVFSVSIETYLDNDRPYEIYGSIRGTEGQNTCFHLYDRGYEDAETIWKRGTLSLTGPENGFTSRIIPENGIFFPFVGINLDICLKDRIRDVEVIKERVNLDSTLEEDSLDKLLKVVIQGEYGIATVYYAIFQFAELAVLKFTITKLKENQSDRFTDIYGSLVAGYGNSERYCNNDDELKNLRTTLLRVTSDQPMPVSVGNPITLFRYVVVVPSYSSIKLEVNLWNSHGENFIGDQVEVQAGKGDNMVYLESQCACLQVEVKWRHAYVQLYKKHNVEGHIKSNEDINSSPMQKKRRVVYDQQLVSSPNVIGYPGVTHFENTQVEVFAVRVYGITKGISALCGTIIIDDGLGKVHIYNKDESSFELLADDGLVSIKGPSRPLSNGEFCMVMNLKDPVQDIEVSKGIVCWKLCNFDMMNMSWYNKRLCSVILGKEGFASVHYTIFDFAFIASIEAKIIFDSPDDVLVNVCGYIWAQYNNFKYSTKYENKYFRSRLLNLPQGRSVELKTGSNIPLCKSLVAGPLESSLLIEADLRITRPFMDGNIKEEAILGIEEFENTMSTTYKDIRGVDYRIEFLVKYSEPE